MVGTAFAASSVPATATATGRRDGEHGDPVPDRREQRDAQHAAGEPPPRYLTADVGEFRRHRQAPVTALGRELARGQRGEALGRIALGPAPPR